MIKISSDFKTVVSALDFFALWFGPHTRLSEVSPKEFEKVYHLRLG